METRAKVLLTPQNPVLPSSYPKKMTKNCQLILNKKSTFKFWTYYPFGAKICILIQIKANSKLQLFPYAKIFVLF